MSLYWARQNEPGARKYSKADGKIMVQILDAIEFGADARFPLLAANGGNAVAAGQLSDEDFIAIMERLIETGQEPPFDLSDDDSFSTPDILEFIGKDPEVPWQNASDFIRFFTELPAMMAQSADLDEEIYEATQSYIGDSLGSVGSPDSDERVNFMRGIMFEEIQLSIAACLAAEKAGETHVVLLYG